MGRLKLLDLFSGAGGAGMGYHRAGFDVFGVDNDPKPLRHYPFPHACGDALNALTDLINGEGLVFSDGRTLFLEDFDAIHASPPCQLYTSLKAMWNRREHLDLIAPTRERLISSDLPWVIENVMGAPLHGIILCGSMFRLGCNVGSPLKGEVGELRRHRLFETSFPLVVSYMCQHGWGGHESATVGVYGHTGGYSKHQRYSVIGVYGGHGRDKRRRKNGQHFRVEARREAMGIDWMTGAELSQAIPPAYTEYIGTHLLRAIAQRQHPDMTEEVF